jgi:hypothetical protein
LALAHLDKNTLLYLEHCCHSHSHLDPYSVSSLLVHQNTQGTLFFHIDFLGSCAWDSAAHFHGCTGNHVLRNKEKLLAAGASTGKHLDSTANCIQSLQHKDV